MQADPFQQIQYTWDAVGNLLQRQYLVSSETETFLYDSLDRLTSSSLPSQYSESYAYNPIGNITSKGGQSYTYGSAKPHAVTAVGATSYAYDMNGNMITRGGVSLTWGVENRPTAIGTSTFVYDGDGNRVKKTEGGQTTHYVNKYYEKLTGGDATLYYYHGDKMVAMKKGSTLTYVHQEHLTSTSVTSDTSGNLVGSIRFYPYGDRRNSTGTIPTDRQFTGQRLDVTGLYYYGARYYDPTIGRFISADSLVQTMRNPQTLNRYSYVINNPLKYTDPTGHIKDPTQDEMFYSNDPWGDDPWVGVTAGSSGEGVIITSGTFSSWRPEPEPLSDWTLTANDFWAEFMAGGSRRQDVSSFLPLADVGPFDQSGQAFTFPNTALGKALGVAGAGVPRTGPRGTTIYEAIDPDSFTGRLMAERLNTTAFTVGYAILTTDERIRSDILEHELGHVTQSAILGPAYLPAYGVAWAIALGHHERNLMETVLLPNWPRVLQ